MIASACDLIDLLAFAKCFEREPERARDPLQRNGLSLATKLLAIRATVADDFFPAVPLLLVGASVRFGSGLVVALFAGNQ
jgi:hypothetical protein